MKSLDIAEHIPALKTRKLSLDQLVKLTEEEWRELNLPVGPRVKLMNAIYNSSGRLNERIPSGNDVIHPPTTGCVLVWGIVVIMQ
jgi:hypothetical protein